MSDFSNNAAICNLHSPSTRRGFVLILVVVVIALLMLTGFTFSELMLTERKAAMVTGRQEQALATAESGVELARSFLLKTTDAQNLAGGWYDNPAIFRSALVVNDTNPSARARVSVIAPLIDNGIYSGVRYGLENESCRLNLNNLAQLAASTTKSPSSDKSTASTSSNDNAGANATPTAVVITTGPREALMNLPGMTQEIADALLDWIDADGLPREYGAESEYYNMLQPPYDPKNGPPDSIEELLLVRGITPWMLFGCDTNRNGRVDADEQANSNLLGVNNSDGSMNCGWASYFTIHSKERNVQSNGQPKINLNDSDVEKLYTSLQQIGLSQEQAAFIITYRQYGPYTNPDKNNEKPSQKFSADNLDLKKEAAGNINSILDLIGAKVQIQKQQENNQGNNQEGNQGGNQQNPPANPPGNPPANPPGNPPANPPATIYDSPFTNTPGGEMNEYLPILMDCTTVDSEKEFVGRININQAPRAVLMCIPGLTSEIVDQIIVRRTMDPINSSSSRRQPTWLLSEGVVTMEQMKKLLPYLTCGGDVYRVQAIGYFDDGGMAARIEAVIDAGTQPPTVLFWRNTSHLGGGFTLEELGGGMVQ